MIIGLTGTLAAGKGTIVEVLKEKGFKHFSVREFISDEIKKRGLEVNRDNMIEIGNKLREENSPSYMAERLFERAKNEKDSIIESLRTVGEIEALRKNPGFVLFAVDADINKRYQRAIARKSSTDFVSFEEFQKKEGIEMNSDDPNKQNLSKCILLADYKFENNGTVEELKREVERILNRIENLKKAGINRPTWDEYFMKIASLVAERSTCLRHNIGAVIVKDKRIMSTGYNGAAKGVKCCLELGCAKNELGIKSGTGHEICRAIHAEQNAIIQGAIHGVKLDGGTMYCTNTPCGVCAKEIVQVGIKKVVSYHDYTDQDAINFLKEGNVELVKVKRPSGTILFKD